MMEELLKAQKKDGAKLTVKDMKGGTPIKVKDMDHLKELREQYGIDHIMDMANEHGLRHRSGTDHPTFDYMKTAVAIGDHIASGKDFIVKKPFKSEKGKFHVRLKGDEEGKTSYRQVDGETVDLGMDGIEAFVHQNADGTHSVSCKRTGLALSSKQGTKLEAIEHAKKRLEMYKDKVHDILSKHPSVPGHGDEKKAEKPKANGTTVKKSLYGSSELDWSFID
jgi:hypothetical protein